MDLNNLDSANRRKWMEQYVLNQGSVTIDELTGQLGVSRMTIHRDLDGLAERGVLRKIRNGATAEPSSLFESDIRYRLHRDLAEKEAMAVVAASLVEPGESVFLDEATTLIPLARRIAEIPSVTIITNFLPLLNELGGREGVRLIALGGEFLRKYATFTGHVCEQSVRNLHADVFFTSTAAVLNGVALHPEQQIVNVKLRMIENSSRRYMLVDHTKFRKHALHRVAPLNSFDGVIVDSGFGRKEQGELEKQGVRILVAQV